MQIGIISSFKYMLYVGMYVMYMVGIIYLPFRGNVDST